jgi:hypothetical protein
VTDSGEGNEHQEIEINLRPPAQVARRVVVLATLCRRAFLESPGGPTELDEDPDAEGFDLLTWLEEHDLDRDLTADERRLLDAAVGTLSRNEFRAATWNAEALLALGWAGGLMPALAEPTSAGDPRSIVPAIPAPWESPAAWIVAFGLRPEEEIARERERAEVWLWRAEIEDERRHLTGRRLAGLETDLRDVVSESVASGLLAGPAHGDFPVAGVPFRSLDGDRVDLIATVAAVRLHALNWLCGFGTAWDDVPLDVD